MAQYRRNFQPSASEYNTSSNAYAYDWPQEQAIPQPRRRRRSVYQESKAERQARHVHVLTYICAAAVVFAGCFLCMSSVAAVSRQRVTNQDLNAQIIALKSQNHTIETELAEKIDLEYIEEQATTRLGMAEPQPYQIMYISVPKESYTVQYDVASAPDEEEEGFSLSSLLQLFE